MTGETTDGILVLRAAAIHGIKDLGCRDDAGHLVVADRFWQVLDRPRPVRAAATTKSGYIPTIWAIEWSTTGRVRQVILPIAWCECADGDWSRCRCIGWRRSSRRCVRGCIG